ncbi:hypothetical protein LTR85_003929 [Meristemomyces frigidus]|nr:hypothetical protein LTR85_003929 [Meristemomyces frigidus]
MNWTDPQSGQTYLQVALLVGRLAIVALLLDRGAEVNRCVPSFGTALHHAARFSNVEVVTTLLHSGAEPNKTDSSGALALHFAIGAVEEVTKINLLIDYGSTIDQVDGDGNTPLCTAAAEGSFRSVEALLACGAAVNGSGTEGSPTPLLYACRNGDAAIAKALLVAKADVNSGSPLPLEVAVSLQHAHMAHLLLQAGARPHTMGRELRNDLRHLEFSVVQQQRLNSTFVLPTLPDERLAVTEEVMKVMEDRCISDFRSCLETRLEPPASVMFIDIMCGRRWGSRLISLASRKETPDALEKVEYLMTLDLDVDAVGLNGRTALHYASEQGYLKMMELLLEAGADMNLTTPTVRPMSSVDLAFRNGSEPTMLLLKARRRVDIHWLVAGNWFYLACLHDYMDVAGFLLEKPSFNLSRTWALLSAVVNGTAEMVALVLEAGAQVSTLPDPIFTTLSDCANGTAGAGGLIDYREAQAKFYFLERHRNLCGKRAYSARGESELEKHTMSDQVGQPDVIVVEDDSDKDSADAEASANVGEPDGEIDMSDFGEADVEDLPCCLDAHEPTDDTGMCPMCDRPYRRLQ